MRMKQSTMILAFFFFNVIKSDLSAISSDLWDGTNEFTYPLSNEMGDTYKESFADQIGRNPINQLSTSSFGENNGCGGTSNTHTESTDCDSTKEEDDNTKIERLMTVPDEKRSATPSNQNYEYLPTFPNYKLRQLEKRSERGRITCDFGKYTTSSRATGSLFETQFSSIEEWGLESNTDSYATATAFVKENGKIRVSLDPRAIWRFMPILFVGLYSFMDAFMGTLRLLAPLIFCRRALVIVYNVVGDYMRGRYVRKAYTRLESAYIHYYETPAMFRALCRTVSQLAVYLILSKIIQFLLEISMLSQNKGRGLAFLYTFIWAGTVVGTGHAFAKALLIWGGPLRLQASTPNTRRRWSSVFTRPWHVFQWLQYMQNPEQWINMVSSPSVSVDPNPLIFPATWFPLRILQMIAVAQVASTDTSKYLWNPFDMERVPKLMRHYLLQLCLSDEWYRVVVGEKRLGLGVCVSIAYLLAMLLFLATTTSINAVATILMIPSFFAMIVTGWMNTVIYLNQNKSGRM